MNSSLDLHPDPGIAGYPSFDLDDPALDPAIAEAAMTSGGYPYADKLKRKAYMRALEALQIELVKLLAWIRDSEERVVVLFEGRDAAGKGGTINAFRANLNPRHARVVALSKPTDRERGEWYFQRYVEHLPTRGEIVLFDRSWYNRGVVEPVMGFSTREEAELFLKEVPQFEGMLVRDGVRLFKLWLNVGREMQLKRFHDRRHSRLKIWKLSPIDLAGLDRWDDYTKARNRMIEASHSWHAPWTIVRSNDKRRARLNAIRHVLRSLPYDDKDEAAIGAIDDSLLGFGPEFLQGIE